MKNIYIVINEDRFFLSHRKEIALAAQKEGYNVTIVAKDTGRRKEIEDLGLTFIQLPINPTGTNLREEFKTFRFLYSLYKKNRPDIVHHVGLKNILWGGLAAKMTSINGVVNAISGLGILFNQEPLSLKAKLTLKVLKYSHNRKNLIAIFQNHEDEALFLNNHIINNEQIVFIKGSGVDLNLFNYTPEYPSDIIKIIFTARMVREKGVEILTEAAEILRSNYENKIEFWLCGGLSNNPSALSEDEMNNLCDGKYIKWLGFRSDIIELLKQSHIMVFPSYYREGLPKSIIDACAIGRPIITTNSVGCKDTVEEGYNGFLIPIKDSKALAEKIEILVKDKNLRQTMGFNSRQLAERDFSLDYVISKHLGIYNKLLNIPIS